MGCRYSTEDPETIDIAKLERIGSWEEIEAAALKKGKKFFLQGGYLRCRSNFFVSLWRHNRVDIFLKLIDMFFDRDPATIEEIFLKILTESCAARKFDFLVELCQLEPSLQRNLMELLARIPRVLEEHLGDYSYSKRPLQNVQWNEYFHLLSCFNRRSSSRRCLWWRIDEFLYDRARAFDRARNLVPYYQALFQSALLQ